MARYIKLSSGSILNGSPITFEIGPNVVAGGNLSFHRVVLEIRCGITGSNYITIKMSAPVLTETVSTTVSIDISSALRTFRDGYAYAADQTIFPLVKFSIGAYDEYMQMVRYILIRAKCFTLTITRCLVPSLVTLRI